MFRIKICGVTNLADAQVAIDAGADALGLNFYERSPRCVSREVAAEIAAACGLAKVKPIGVFVNAPPSYVVELAEQFNLAAVQLHGDEPPEIIDDLPLGMRVIFALRLPAAGGLALPNYRHLSKYQRLPAALLADAAAPGQYGGTGHKLDWTALANWPAKTFGIPLILAGGLTPKNVIAAIRICHPAGVDAASGVESSPGKKDPAKTRDFIAAAKAAFAEAD
jgi:phosphoribosylanthranilate isomerase